MITVEHLTKTFGGVQAVNNCSFTVPRGKIIGLIGPNGAGKTTVFNIITGFMRSDSGNIIFDRTEISHLRPDQIFQLGISRTFQSIRLFPKLTVLENVLLAIKGQREGAIHAVIRLPMWRRATKHHREKAHEILAQVGLQGKENERAGEISYGQQKLLEIARALASDPELLLLDEPAAGVNPTLLKQIRDLLLNLKKQGKTILLVEHDMEFVMGICDSIVVLDYGKEIALGTPKEICKNPKVLEAYLGA